MTEALEGGEWSAACPGCTLPPGKDPVPIVQEAGCAPDRPARSQSLYRLSYLAHDKQYWSDKIMMLNK